jgi:hypothetical protein
MGEQRLARGVFAWCTVAAELDRSGKALGKRHSALGKMKSKTPMRKQAAHAARVFPDA